MKRRMSVLIRQTGKPYSEEDKLPYMKSYDALELEAAAALLMLRYQYDIKAVGATACTTLAQTTPSPPPPPPAAIEIEEYTPKEPMRSVMSAASQPLKKRSIPPHLLRRSLTPAKASPHATPTASGNSSNNSSCVISTGGSQITKAKLKVKSSAACNKALLKSCRNMIREFLDNQELI